MSTLVDTPEFNPHARKLLFPLYISYNSVPLLSIHIATGFLDWISLVRRLCCAAEGGIKHPLLVQRK